MKISELIKAAQSALAEHGDIDVCTPAPDDGIDEEVNEVTQYKVRRAGSPYVPEHKWDKDSHRLVFVVA